MERYLFFYRCLGYNRTMFDILSEMELGKYVARVNQ
jgi:hypothetical protein